MSNTEKIKATVGRVLTEAVEDGLVYADAATAILARAEQKLDDAIEADRQLTLAKGKRAAEQVSKAARRAEKVLLFLSGIVIITWISVVTAASWLYIMERLAP